MEAFESHVAEVVGWLKLFLEATGAALVFIGGVTAVVMLLRAMLAAGRVHFTPVRLNFAKYLSLALEFQLAADILGTSIAPSWPQIGKLGAIAVIRTGLNYFLTHEMREEKEMIAAEEAVRTGMEPAAAPPRAD